MQLDRRMIRRQWVHNAVCLSLLALSGLTGLVGCGKGGGGGTAPAAVSPDEEALRGLVTRIPEYAGRLEEFRKLFTKDKAPRPADPPKYLNTNFIVSGAPTISGDSATIPVQVIKVDPNTGTEQPPIQKEWKAAKEGGEWKLTDAPIS